MTNLSRQINYLEDFKTWYWDLIGASVCSPDLPQHRLHLIHWHYKNDFQNRFLWDVSLEVFTSYILGKTSLREAIYGSQEVDHVRREFLWGMRRSWWDKCPRYYWRRDIWKPSKKYRKKPGHAPGRAPDSYRREKKHKDYRNSGKGWYSGRKCGAKRFSSRKRRQWEREQIQRENWEVFGDSTYDKKKFRNSWLWD